MPKRSAEEKIERYEKKIQKLRETKKPRKRVIFSDSSDNEGPDVVNEVTATVEIHNTSSTSAAAKRSSNTASVSNPNIEQAPELVREPDAEPEPELEPEIVPESAQSADAISTPEPQLDLSTPEPQLDLSTPEPQLDPELIEALGESTDDTPEYGPNIQDNLAKLWLPLLKKGLSKDSKDKLLKEYLVPDNCRLLQSPKLNPEISAAVLEGIRNRDKGMVSQQQQLGFGITAVNRSLDLLLTGDDKKQAIRHLSNACRILSDLHATFTQNRIKLITPSLERNFHLVVQDSERDETLFGNKLPDKIKAAKAIEKQGQQIKKGNNRKIPNTSSHYTATRASTSGNWIPPPPRFSFNRGSRGGPKKYTSYNRRPYQNATTTTQPPPRSATSAAKPRATAPQ